MDSPGRPADLYVFAWHGERRDRYADQRDANQWVFFVVAERDLPKNRKSIGLKELESISALCRIEDPEPIVENTCPAPEALKAVRGGHSL